MNRTITIIDKNTNEQLMITWPEAIVYYEGHSSFDELKNKYKGEDNENKKNKF